MPDSTDDILVPYLRMLSHCDCWAPTELPKEITEGVLRALTQLELIEFKAPVMGWYSPAREHHVGGTFAAARHRGFPIRVSDAGRALLELANLRANATAGDGQNATAIGPKVHPAVLALSILLTTPDITPTTLAEQVGVSRGTLYGTRPPWKAVRDTLTARGKGDRPHGTKYADENVEAISDPATND